MKYLLLILFLVIFGNLYSQPTIRLISINENQVELEIKLSVDYTAASLVWDYNIDPTISDNVQVLPSFNRGVYNITVSGLYSYLSTIWYFRVYYDDQLPPAE
ncbi:MAG: hypothetical protein C0599_08310, partial [Salinivirgaceae bacterium]